MRDAAGNGQREALRLRNIREDIWTGKVQEN